MDIKWRIGILGALLISAAGFIGYKKTTDKHEGAVSTTQIKYQCPMHPQIVKDQPGDCPICHMRLVPMENKVDAQGSQIPGQSTVQMTESQQQLIGVRLGTVEQRSLGATIRASARVAYDPDLYNAILEHQQALANLPKQGAESPFQTEAANTVRATRLRLSQMGLSDDQIRTLSGANFDASSLLVPKLGGTAWVYADIYSHEAPLVKRGQKVELTSSALPGRTFSGTVQSIDSVLNADTRTLRARIEVPKAGGELKPEMYLAASIQTSEGLALAVPKSAILPTGTRQVAFVEVGPGQYEPRDVRLGRETDDYFEVISGLKEGEKVVTSANFLIDSESKLKSAIQGVGQSHDQKPTSQEKSEERQPASGHVH